MRGNFKIDTILNDLNTLTISDPTLDRGHWGQANIKVKNGLWSFQIKQNNDGKPTELKSWRIGSAIDDITLLGKLECASEIPYICIVDSNLFGYFDGYQYTLNKSSDIPSPMYNNTVTSTFYDTCLNQVGVDGVGVFPYGVVIRVPNGSYKTTGVTDSDGNYIALSTVFISGKYSDDWDEDGDDENFDMDEEEL